MPVSKTPRIRNQLLCSLPEHSWRLISPHLEALPLPKSFVIASKDHRMNYVYFPDSGVASVILASDGGFTAEAGMAGREGFSPTAVAAGGDISLHEIVMQVPGEGHRIDSESLRAVMEQDREFERILFHYIHVFATQVSFTALANAGNKTDVRLARWLLMCHDRVDGDEFHLTHEYMAVMLAVRRATVTVALHDLEGKGFIRSRRNQIVIRDRAGLEAFAGDAYGGPEREYRMLPGKTRPNGQDTRDGAPASLLDQAKEHVVKTDLRQH